MIFLLYFGVSDTLTQLCENYLYLRDRQTVETCLNKCLISKKIKIKHGSQLTAQLPLNRVRESMNSY